LTTALIANTDPHLDQRCTSDNCKTFDTAISPKHCKTCWDTADAITNYNSWPARLTYTGSELVGVLQANPFELDGAAHTCVLQCKAGYYRPPYSDPLLQECLICSDNCKTCVTAEDNCTSCWQDAGITNADWVGSDTYTDQEVMHRHAASPFTHFASENRCILNCKDHYWSNDSSTYNKASDPLDQRCTSTNCKAWDYAANLASNTPDTCAQCWANAD
jgi:hypothetical protein